MLQGGSYHRFMVNNIDSEIVLVTQDHTAYKWQNYHLMLILPYSKTRSDIFMTLHCLCLRLYHFHFSFTPSSRIKMFANGIEGERVIAFFFEFYFIYFLYGRFLLVIYFIHISVYMTIPISQFIPPPPLPPLSPLGVHTFVLYICVSISALQTSSSVPFF